MKKILIVDDEIRITQAFELVFQNDFKVRSAHEGDEALRLIQGEPPDILVLDWRLKGRVEGKDVLDFVKKKYPNILTFVVTASIDFVKEIESYHPTAYFLKPCPDLKDRIEKFIK